MNTFKKLDQRGNSFFITSRRPFKPLFSFSKEIIKRVYDFATGMTFSREGEHRDHRSGGQHRRKNGEIFANAFQGKLTEFGLFKFLGDRGIQISSPDVAKWELGKWDAIDLLVLNKKVNIKSTKHFGNLLLLETKDWNSDALYLPNISKGTEAYDIFVLTRIDPSCEDILKGLRFLYSEVLNKADLDKLSQSIHGATWRFDIAGWLKREDLKDSIINGNILPQNSMLNGTVKMDAENYYVQAGDMLTGDELVKYFSK